MSLAAALGAVAVAIVAFGFVWPVAPGLVTRERIVLVPAHTVCDAAGKAIGLQPRTAYWRAARYGWYGGGAWDGVFTDAAVTADGARTMQISQLKPCPPVDPEQCVAGVAGAFSAAGRQNGLEPGTRTTVAIIWKSAAAAPGDGPFQVVVVAVNGVRERLLLDTGELPPAPCGDTN